MVGSLVSPGWRPSPQNKFSREQRLHIRRGRRNEKVLDISVKSDRKGTRLGMLRKGVRLGNKFSGNGGGLEGEALKGSLT